MAQLRVGIVGCGRMGRERARCSEASGAQVAAVFDIEPERSSDLASKYGAESLNRPEDFFGRGLDAIFVCTAPGARGPAEGDCIHAGLPFYVEKPIGISLERSRDTLARLQQSPVLNGVGYMNRYRRSIALAKEVLKTTEAIGFSAYWVCKRYGVPWWESEIDSGGPHNEQATHLFDLCRYLLGDIERVQSSFRENSQVSSLLECRRGVLGTAFYSCDGNEKNIGLRIFTRHGSLTLSGWNFCLAENTVDGRLVEENEDIFLVETASFLEAVQSGHTGLVKSDFFDAAQTQAVMDAVRESGLIRHSVGVEIVRGVAAYA